MCAYCKTARASHIDHVNPLSKGGSHTVENLLPSCPTCNFKKHNKTPDVWAAESGVDLTGLLGKVRSLGGENNKGDLPN